MSELVARAESAPGIPHAFVDINDRTVTKSDDLSFTADEASVLNLDSDTKRDCRNIDISRLGDPQFDQKFFCWAQGINPSDRHFR